MSSKGPAEPFRKLLPQSWLGWFAAFVLGVVAVTHPAESWHATSRSVWGAGRWAGYEAFAHCGDPAPYTWMSPKRCPADTVSDPQPPVTVSSPAGGPVGDGGAQSMTHRAVVEVTHLHRIVDATLTADGAKYGQHKTGGRS